MIISATRDWPLEPTGSVPKNELGVMSKSRARVPLARIDPKSWAPMYKGTWEINKVRVN